MKCYQNLSNNTNITNNNPLEKTIHNDDGKEDLYIVLSVFFTMISIALFLFLIIYVKNKYVQKINTIAADIEELETELL